MSLAVWIIAGIAVLVASGIALEAFLKRNRRRTLSSTQPGSGRETGRKIALGQEATDMDLVKRTHRENQLLSEKGWRWNRWNRF